MPACVSLAADTASVDLQEFNSLIDQVAKKVGCAQESDVGAELRKQVFILVTVIATTLETSNLLSVAGETEMLEARRVLRAVGRLVQVCIKSISREEDQDLWAAFWTVSLAVKIGPRLFLFILMLLREGYGEALHLSAVEIEKLSSHWQKADVGAAGKILNDARTVSRFRRRRSAIWRGSAGT